jgi:ectoine hydroxylase-related dioxygenase (phytanoyl-CoA dioxygenase family)
MAIVLATVASHSNLEQTMNAWLSQTQRDEFRHRGVTCLRGALESDEMTVLRAAFDWTLANPGRGASRVAPGMPGTLYGDLANSESFGAYRNVNTKTSLPSIIAELFSTPDVWYMYEQVFLKTGGDDAPARRTPWHQDESYLPVTGEDLAVAWISFGPLSAVESLEFVVGSHRGTLYDGSRFDPSDDTIPLYGTGELPRLPDIEANRADYDICSFSVDPGDIVFFHPAMLHGGAPALPSSSRSTLSLRYFGEDSTVALRPNDTAETLSRIRETTESMHPMQRAKLLGAGAPFRDDGFPQVAT